MTAPHAPAGTQEENKYDAHFTDGEVEIHDVKPFLWDHTVRSSGTELTPSAQSKVQHHLLKQIFVEKMEKNVDTHLSLL